MKVVLVVGMHRSATSLVAGGLHQTGCHMGDHLIEPSGSNPEGHFECTRAVELNERILQANHGEWFAPPPRVDPDTYRDEVSAYIEERGSRDLWGVKDPRLCITWPVWLPLLRKFDLHVVTVYRSPDEIARSLWRRNSLPIHYGHELAERYQQRMSELVESL